MFLLLPFRLSHAISFTVNPSLSNTTVSFETQGTPNGTTVQFSIDTGGQVAVNFFQVSPADGSLTQVATLNQTYTSGGAKTVFWNALWLIGLDNGRKNGNFAFQVVASSNNTASFPPLGDPAGRFQITSIDIHDVSVSPTLDANGNPAFPYAILYKLAKAGLATVTVKNASGSTVRTLLTNEPAFGEEIGLNAAGWNGLGNDGRPVSVGVYTVTIDALDPTNSDLAIPRTRTISVGSLAGLAADPKDLFERNVFVFPNPVRNGLGTFQFQAIRNNADISLKIYTITGDLVFEKEFTNIAAGNVTQFQWNATNQAGNKVGRGLYYYVVREEDPEGTLQTTKKMAVLP